MLTLPRAVTVVRTRDETLEVTTLVFMLTWPDFVKVEVEHTVVDAGFVTVVRLPCRVVIWPSWVCVSVVEI